VKQVHFISSGMQLLSAGDDSVLKLWNIASSECVATFPDAHDGKIWGMTVTRDGQSVLTGGSDSVLCVWADCSALDVEEAAAAKETFVLQEQQLNNLVRNKHWKKAVRLALTLEQPRKCLSIVQELLLQERASQAPSQLAEICAEIGADVPAAESSQPQEDSTANPSSDVLLSRLLLYIRDWNTHAKSSHAAQRLLEALLRALPPARLLANRTLLQQAATLQLYSQRHFARLDKLLTKSHLLDHMLTQMHAVEPEKQSSSNGHALVKRQGDVLDADDVLQQLLASSTQSPQDIALAAATAPIPPTAAGATSDGDSGFSDDDGSAWATNWQLADGESSSSDSDAEQKEAAHAKRQATLQASIAASSAKRKQPTDRSAAAQETQAQVNDSAGESRLRRKKQRKGAHKM
jgi:hypothetical protein